MALRSLWLLACFAALLPAQLHLDSFATFPATPNLRHFSAPVEVVLSYAVDAQGRPHAIESHSGRPPFVEAAERHLRSWRLVGDLPTARRQVTYRFAIVPELGPGPYDSGRHEVHFEGLDLVHIRLAPYRLNSALRCPANPLLPPDAPLSPSDSVTLKRSGPWNSPVYDLRLYADGRVTWNGRKSVAALGPREARIPAATAQTLLNRFRAPDVWALCANYESAVFDFPSADLEVDIAGQRKSVHNYANAAPPWFNSLLAELEQLTDTPRFVHGDPSRGASLQSHPGGLIQARRHRAHAIRPPLAAPAGLPHLKAQDSSGWTALHYVAALPENRAAIDQILAAGADPRLRHRRGRTARDYLEAASTGPDPESAEAAASCRLLPVI